MVFRSTAKELPEFALVSTGFYQKMVNQRTLLGTTGADFSYINGEVGQAAGLRIIVTDLAEDIILSTAAGLHIATASSVKQIPGTGNIVGSADMTNAEIGFSAGMISKTDVKPTFVGMLTYVHKPFGLEVIPELVMKVNNIPTP